MKVPGTYIKSVGRACKVLAWIGEEDDCSASEISRAFEWPLSTVHHLLGTLVSEEFLAKEPDRRYVLGPRAGILADAVARQHAVDERLMGPLRWLAETSEETAYLVVWKRGEIAILASVEGVRAVRVAGIHVGYIQNAHARASGKLMLALADPAVREAYLTRHPPTALTAATICEPGALATELELIRERGYATEDEEFAEGVACIAAPLLGEEGPIGAYSISLPAQRMKKDREGLLDAVRRAAAAGGAGGTPKPGALAGTAKG